MIKFLNGIRNYDNIPAYRILDGEDYFDISFADFYKRSQQVAFNLQQMIGDLKGKRIGIYCDSTYEYTYLITAIVFSRAIVVPLNIHESVDNISYEVQNAELDYLIVDNDKLSSVPMQVGFIEKED